MRQLAAAVDPASAEAPAPAPRKVKGKAKVKYFHLCAGKDAEGRREECRKCAARAWAVMPGPDGPGARSR